VHDHGDDRGQRPRFGVLAQMLVPDVDQVVRHPQGHEPVVAALVLDE
jgi:hypothetical protein